MTAPFGRGNRRTPMRLVSLKAMLRLNEAVSTFFRVTARSIHTIHA